jgi:hypothetical protein
MTLRETIYNRCTGHAGTAALIDVRCYPVVLPENVTLPAISYVLVSADSSEYQTHDGATPREVSRVQFNCWAATGDAAAALGDQVRAAWDGYKDGCDVGYAWQANRLSTREPALEQYRDILDFMIEHPIP